MTITDIKMRINKNNTDSNILATASIQLDNCLVIHDLKLVQLRDRRIVSFPNKRRKRIDLENGEQIISFEFTDIVHPSTKELRNYIEECLFTLYDKNKMEVEE